MALRDITVNLVVRAVQLTGTGFNTPVYTTSENPYTFYDKKDGTDADSQTEYILGWRKQLTGSETFKVLNVTISGAAIAHNITCLLYTSDAADE